MSAAELLLVPTPPRALTRPRHLDTPAVLEHRWRRLPEAWREKEWWFSYAYDEKAGLYLSWSFTRAFAAEKFRCWAHDLRTGESWHVDEVITLRPPTRPGLLELVHEGRDVAVAFTGEPDGTLRFRLEAPSFRAELNIDRTDAPFTKRDNTFDCWYALVHDVHNRVRGTVAVGLRDFSLDTRNGYSDHCFGRVPSKTGWHWLAVQNDRFALASLVNHGPAAQRYTQVQAGGAWVRLNETVTFDYDHTDLRKTWRVTSPELDLVVEPLALHADHIQVPPVVPFLVNLHHTELAVRVRGRVRLEGRWEDVGVLHGVLEEHHGRW